MAKSKSKSKVKSKSKSKSKVAHKSKNRGLLTAAEGVAAKGYSIGKDLGDVEITMEQIKNKIGIVICTIFLIVVGISTIYQIVNVIYRSITGKSLCDLLNICSKDSPHNLFHLNPITNRSQVIECRDTPGKESASKCMESPVLRDQNKCDCKYDEVDLNDLRGNVIQMFMTICSLIIIILIITSFFTSHRINEMAKHNSAYRAAKGAQFVGNMYYNFANSRK